jgi:hypothetical protein
VICYIFMGKGTDYHQIIDARCFGGIFGIRRCRQVSHPLAKARGKQFDRRRKYLPFFYLFTVVFRDVMFLRL